MSQLNVMTKMLKKAGKRGVYNYQFAQIGILRYNARITDLRQDGLNILCERVKLPNGRSTGVFRYTLIGDENA